MVMNIRGRCYIFLSSSQVFVGLQVTACSVWSGWRPLTGRGGVVHSLPPELHASWISRGLCGAAEEPCWLETWHAASSGSLKLSQCAHKPICEDLLSYDTSTVCFHPVVYCLCPQRGPVRKEKTIAAFSCAILNLAHETLKLERPALCVLGTESVFHKHRITSEHSHLTFRASTICLTTLQMVWFCSIRKRSQVIRLKYLSPDSASCAAAAEEEIRRASLPVCCSVVAPIEGSCALYNLSGLTDRVRDMHARQQYNPRYVKRWCVLLCDQTGLLVALRSSVFRLCWSRL